MIRLNRAGVCDTTAALSLAPEENDMAARRFWFGCMVLSMGVLVLSACQDESGSAISPAGLDELARQMLEAIASETPGDFYDASFSSLGKGDLPRDEWLTLARAYRLRFGPVASIEPLAVTASTLGGAEQGSGLYKVTWKKGEGTLKINCTRKGGAWKINSYQLASPQIQPTSESASTQPS